MEQIKKRILFFGSDHISQRVLQKLHQGYTDKIQVVCPPSTKPRTPLALFHDRIKYFKLKVFQEIKQKEDFEFLDEQLQHLSQEEKPQVGIVASFGHMIPDKIIDHFHQDGMFVIHPSLLPKYRGSCPIQHAILNRDKQTGVSIIEISKNKFDAGKILWQEKVEINEKTDFESLSKQLADLGGQGMCELLKDLPGFKERGLNQDPSQVTSARMIKNEFGILKFSELDALDIHYRFNALNGSNTKPRGIIHSGFDKKLIGTTIYFDKLHKIGKINQFFKNFSTSDPPQEIKTLNLNIPEGALYVNHKKNKDVLYIKAKGDDQWVHATQVTLSGFGKMPVNDFNVKVLKHQTFKQNDDPQFKFRLE